MHSKGTKLPGIPSTLSCVPTCRGGSTNAPTDPGAQTNPALLLNRRGGRLTTRAAPNIVSVRSLRQPGWMTPLPPTPGGTPSPPPSSVVARISYWSPNYSDTLARIPFAPTLAPRPRTAPKSSPYSSLIADQRLVFRRTRVPDRPATGPVDAVSIDYQAPRLVGELCDQEFETGPRCLGEADCWVSLGERHEGPRAPFP